MIVYSIKDLEKLSGIRAHTLRIWEKRFGIIMPKRTKTNIRYYDECDLQKVINIALLRKNGYKISKIVELAEPEFKKLTVEFAKVDLTTDDDIDVLTMAMIEFDEYKFDLILEHYISKRGFARTMEEVVYPFIEKLRMMCMAETLKPVHKNFVTYYLKRKCISAIDINSCSDSPSFILYLPEDETHELSLLYVHYLLSSHGIKVINLGTDISLLEVVDACNTVKPNYIFTLINDSCIDSGLLQKYIDDLLKNSIECKIVISGYQSIANKLNNNERLLKLSSISEIKQLIKQLT